MLSALLASAALVAFPKEGQSFPYLERVYMIGATAKGDTNVVVRGENVPVYRTGAWATVVEVTEGTNDVSVVTQRGEATNVCFRVAAKPAPGPQAPEKVWTKLEYAGDVPQDPPTNKAPAEITVTIDAGHGGDDKGATSPHGFFEKDANLALARLVKRELVARGYRVVMTREDDSFPALYDRPKVAHANRADAFISIHHNAPGYDADPREKRYHAVYSWNPIGEKLARAVNAKMAAALGDTLESKGCLHANFAVTRNPQIPSCLVEADFITSPAGEEASWSGPRRVLVAKAIADGFAAWCRGEEFDLDTKEDEQ